MLAVQKFKALFVVQIKIYLNYGMFLNSSKSSHVMPSSDNPLLCLDESQNFALVK